MTIFPREDTSNNEDSYFPLLIKLSETNEYAVAETPADLPNGKYFKVLRTKYWENACGPDTKAGDRVIFIPHNGYSGQHDNAMKSGLEHMKTYVVEDVAVHSYSTNLFLQGYNGLKFNSVMFIKLEDHE